MGTARCCLISVSHSICVKKITVIKTVRLRRVQPRKGDLELDFRRIVVNYVGYLNKGNYGSLVGKVGICICICCSGFCNYTRSMNGTEIAIDAEAEFFF